MRGRALEALFGLLREFGPAFSASFWGLVYRGVLLPMFDDVHHAHRPESPIAAGGCPPRRTSGPWGRPRVPYRCPPPSLLC